MMGKRERAAAASATYRGELRAARTIRGYVQKFHHAVAEYAGESNRVSALVLRNLTGELLCRLRGIDALWREGLIEESHILTRALFETVLAISFIVRPRRRLSSCTSSLRSELQKWPRFPTNCRAIDFRAKLYYHSDALKQHAHNQRLLDRRGFKRLGRRLSLVSAFPMPQIERDIGPEWMERIRRAGNYSGIRSVALLAEYCGMSWYYLTAYNVQSDHGHGGMAMNLPEDADVSALSHLISIVCSLALRGCEGVDRALDLPCDDLVSRMREVYVFDLNQADL